MFQEIENVKYVKAEGKNFLLKTEEIINISDNELEVIGGAGGKNMIHLLRLGVTSFMTGTEALDLHASVVNVYLSGDEEKAAEIYYQKIMPYFAFYDNYPEELLKAMLYEQGIIDHPEVITPRAKEPMSKIEWREFNWVLDRIGFRNKWTNIP